MDIGVSQQSVSINNYREANLKNVFYALSALFVLNNYLLKKIVDKQKEPDVVDDMSKVFTMINWKTRWNNIRDLYLDNEDK